MGIAKSCAVAGAVCWVLALACLGAVAWLGTLSAQAALADVAAQTAASGLEVSAVLAVASLLTVVLSLRRRTRMAGYILLVCTGAALGSAVVQSTRLFVRIVQVGRNLGVALPFAVRAPGYADALMLLLGGLAAAGIALLGLALLEKRWR